MVLLTTLGILFLFTLALGFIGLAGWGVSSMLDIDLPGGVIIFLCATGVVSLLVSLAYELAVKLVGS